MAQADLLASASMVSDHYRVEGLQEKKRHFGFEFPVHIQDSESWYPPPSGQPGSWSEVPAATWLPHLQKVP